MRAIYVPTLAKQIEASLGLGQLSEAGEVKIASLAIALDGATLHHLKRVIRLRSGERIKLLDGCGRMVVAITEKILDKALGLKEGTFFRVSPPRPWDLVVGLTQEFADVVRIAQELGVRRLYPWNSLFTNQKEVAKLKTAAAAAAASSSSSFSIPSSLMPSNTYARWKRIAINALEQSNAPWLIQIEGNYCLPDKTASFKALQAALSSSTQVVVAHWAMDHSAPQITNDLPRLTSPVIKPDQKLLLILGPEGGIAPEEWQVLQSLPQHQLLTLPTPILRTPTAVGACYGHLLR